GECVVAGAREERLVGGARQGHLVVEVAGKVARDRTRVADGVARGRDRLGGAVELSEVDRNALIRLREAERVRGRTGSNNADLVGAGSVQGQVKRIGTRAGAKHRVAAAA